MTKSSVDIPIEIKDLECPVCLDMFDENTRTLPCHHSFHLSCLEKIPLHIICGLDSSLTLLSCPICRHHFPIQDSVSSSFRRNHLLISILQKVQHKLSEDKEKEEKEKKQKEDKERENKEKKNKKKENKEKRKRKTPTTSDTHTSSTDEAPTAESHETQETTSRRASERLKQRRTVSYKRYY